MCDQTEVVYEDKDVVWVKLGSMWWPGEVKAIDKLENKDELLFGLRSEPLAVVKFFDEENYEFVKNLEHICHYNSRRKEDFIKKGLDKYRLGHSHMSKFPDDIRKAEILVGGDPDILNDPLFAPPKKSNYSGIFGTPARKKLKKEEDSVKKLVRRHTIGSSRPVPGTIQERYVRPVKKGPLIEPGAVYSCPFCKFQSRLINNIATHFRMIHTPSGYTSYAVDPVSKVFTPHVARESKIGVKRNKVKKSIPKLNETAVATLKPKPKPKPQEPKIVEKEAKKVETPTPERKKPRFTDALLADWSDEEINEFSETLNEDISQKTPEENKQNVETKEGVAAEQKDYKKKEKESCFDFDDEEDGFIGMSDANTYGRKIPRVIPIKDKTDLGMDLDFEELFKRKPEAPKKRGRPKKEGKTLIKKEKKMVDSEVPKTLAATRSRRPGSRKSYSNEMITPIKEDFVSPDNLDLESDEEEKEEEDDVQMEGRKVDDEQKTEDEEEETEDEKVLSEGETVRKRKTSDTMQSRSKRKQVLSELDELPDIPVDGKQNIPKKRPKYFAEKVPQKSESGKPKEAAKNDDLVQDEFKSQIDALLSETTVPKIPESEEEVDNTVEYLEDEMPEAEIQKLKVEPAKPAPAATPNVVKVRASSLKNGSFILVKPSPGSKTGAQQVMLVASSPQQKVTVLANPSASSMKPKTTVALPKKVYQISPQKILLSTAGKQVRRVIFKDSPNKTVRLTESGKNLVVLKEKPLGMQQRLVFTTSGGSERKVVALQQRSATTVKSLEPKQQQPSPKVITLKQPQAVAVEPQPVVVENPPAVVPSSQVVAMQGPAGPDGQPTYILVSLDEHGILQPVDPQGAVPTGIINFPSASSSSSAPQTDRIDVAPGQDILAAALASTLDGDGESSLMQETLPSRPQKEVVVTADTSVAEEVPKNEGEAPLQIDEAEAVAADSPIDDSFGQDDTISDQDFEAQKRKYLPTTTTHPEEEKESQDMPFIDEGITVNRSQDTEVTSTTKESGE